MNFEGKLFGRRAIPILYAFGAAFLCLMLLTEVSDLVVSWTDPHFPIGADAFGLRYASRWHLAAFTALQAVLTGVGIIVPPKLYARGRLQPAAAVMAVAAFGSVAIVGLLLWDVG
jgi:hypothetical protein